MRYTKKKIKPRHNNIDFDKLNCMRILFSHKIAQLLNQEKLIINIYKSSINRHMSTDKSWEFKEREIDEMSLSFWN